MYRIEGSNELIREARDLLFYVSKPTLYKYAGILAPYGYKYGNLLNVRNHYVVKFLNEVEFPVDNIIWYFVGFINHQLYRIINQESANKRLANYSTLSFEQCLEGEDNYSLYDKVQSGENIQQWYSGQDILNNFIKNDENHLLSAPEKEIMDLKIEGNTFCEISEEIGISYKQVVYIYKKAVKKLKQLMIPAENKLQNSLIF